MKSFKSFLIISIFCLILFFTANTFFAKPKFEHQECANIFSSKIYEDYQEKLKIFIRAHPDYPNLKMQPHSELCRQLKDLDTLLDCSFATPSEKRKAHEKFVKLLRQAIQLSADNLQSVASQFVNDIVNWLFLSVNLNKQILRFVYNHVEPPQNNLFSYCLKTQKLLYNDPRFVREKKTLEQEDNFLFGNLPSVYFVLSTPCPAKILRFGVPIIEDLKFPWLLQIAPEFLCFIKQKPNHLYVNLMKRYGREKRATKKIEALERRFEGFFVATLDKDSDFYQQTNAFSLCSDVEDFKKVFLEQMTKKNGTYYWPKALEKSLWFLELASIVDGIQHRYFLEKTHLSKSERKDFIELTYLAILDALVEKLSPASINISCHHGMDRAPSILALWMLQKKAASEKEITALFLGPPLLIHNRASHRSRVERFVSSAEKIRNGKYE